MAHWAELDDDDVVLRVIVCDPELDEGGEEVTDPPAFCSEVLGGRWVRTYYATKGKTYAGIGYAWDGTTFTAPEPPPPSKLDVADAIELLEDQAVLTAEEADKARAAAEAGK